MIIDVDEGYIVINNYVVEDVEKMIVIFEDGCEYEVIRIGSDKELDIVLL